MTATLQVYAPHPTLFMQMRLLTSTGLATCFKLSMDTSICKTYVRKQERNTKIYSEDASCFKTPVRRIQNYFWLATYNLTYSIRSTRLTKRRGTGLGTARYSPEWGKPTCNTITSIARPPLAPPPLQKAADRTASALLPPHSLPNTPGLKYDSRRTPCSTATTTGR